MTSVAADATQVSEEYYDSPDADTFYKEIWGGEDIHIGLYAEGDTIREASRKTVLHMAQRLNGLGAGAKVLDIGAGYGGAARVLAREYGAHVTCLNLSEVENERNRALNTDQGLSDRVSVLHGSFEDVPCPDGSFDIVWSQDAILHSGNREKVLEEVARTLKPGGEFIFTDPMQADDIDDPAVLQPIYDRLHLRNLGSVAFYRARLRSLGLEEISFEDLTPHLSNHYARVGRELAANREALKGRVSAEYTDRMLTGLNHWVEGGLQGHLVWGILHFSK